MKKITIIGLGLVGNSIGMGLKRATLSQQGSATSQSAFQIVGLDPDRQREADALRKYGSVDAVAKDLEEAVSGSELVVISTPASATREVMAAIDPYLGDGAVVTDTLASKEQIMRWAGETLGGHVSFVGGHAMISKDNAEAVSRVDAPNPDLFRDARWAIMPARGATNSALNTVIWLAETLGAAPLFIDPMEHDSFLAAVNQLPVVASAALWKVAHSSPSWGDMEPFAQSGFKGLTEPLSASPEMLTGAFEGNRQALIGWVDRYLIALQEMRDTLVQGQQEGESSSLFAILEEAHAQRQAWVAESGMTGDEKDVRLRAELREEIDEARPTRSFMGSYLSERIFKKKDK